MRGLAVVGPGSFGDTGLPQIGIASVTKIPGATLDWVSTNLPSGPTPVWYDTIQGMPMEAPGFESQNPVARRSIRSVLRFDGVNDRMDVSLNLSGAKTLVFVARFASNAANTYAFTGGQGPAFNLYVRADGTFAFYAGATLGSGIPSDNSLTHAFIIVSNGANSVLSVDGREVAGDAGISTATTLRLAATSSAYSQMDFERVALIPGAATAGQRSRIYALLKAQHNI